MYALVNTYVHVDIDECGLGTDQCAQNCHNYIGSYTCSCNAGYILNSDGCHCDGRETIATMIVFLTLSSLDIDECGLGTHQCAQNCSDTVGSYTCNCRTGYTLNADGQHCDGM